MNSQAARLESHRLKRACSTENEPADRSDNCVSDPAAVNQREYDVVEIGSIVDARDPGWVRRRAVSQGHA